MLIIYSQLLTFRNVQGRMPDMEYPEQGSPLPVAPCQMGKEKDDRAVRLT